VADTAQTHDYEDDALVGDGHADEDCAGAKAASVPRIVPSKRIMTERDNSCWERSFWFDETAEVMAFTKTANAQTDSLAPTSVMGQAVDLRSA